MSLSPERKLKKAKIDVMRSTLPGLRLWAGIMSVGTTTLDDTGKVKTAYTNGRDEVYGRAFVDTLPVQQLSFVCLHEAMHKGLRHLTVWRKLFDEDHRLANIACDYVVNRMIVAADRNEQVVQFPRNPDGTKMGLYDPKYDGMSAKQVFDDLKKNPPPPPPSGGGSGQGGDGSPSGGGSGQGGDGSPSDGFDEHDWDGAQNLPQEERDALEKEIDHALRRGEAEAKKCGAGKGDMPAEIGEMLRPQIDWKNALREFVTQHCARKDDTTYRRINRRFHAMDLILPTTYGENMGHLVVGADLSGSMWCGDPSPMTKIFSELVGITRMVNPEHLDLLYWDTHVAGHEEYRQGDYEAMLSSMKPKGGGGTDPSCVPAYLKDKRIKPDCIVMLTDGEVFNQWGKDWPAPVLWVICENPSIVAGTGKTVHVQ
jgi:predicted metal-dependent peptidase